MVSVVVLATMVAPQQFAVVANKADLFVDGHTAASATKIAGDANDKGYSVYAYLGKEGDFVDLQVLPDAGAHCERPNPRFSGLELIVRARESDLALVNTRPLSARFKDGTSSTLAPGHVVVRVPGRAGMVAEPGLEQIQYPAPADSVGTLYSPAPPRPDLPPDDAHQLIFGKLNGIGVSMHYHQGDKHGHFATHVDACGTMTIALDAKSKIWPPEDEDGDGIAGGVIASVPGSTRTQQAAELRPGTPLSFSSGRSAGRTAQLQYVSDGDLIDDGVDDPEDDRVCYWRNIGERQRITLCFHAKDGKLVRIPKR